MAELKLILQSDLCAGNGEATGSTVDTDICIDEFGFPYLPARRLKGVLRDAAAWLVRCGGADADAVEQLFGTSDSPGRFRLSDAVLPGTDAMRAYIAGGVSQELKRAATPLNIARLFTSVRGQTRLENGVAADGTLRYTRVLDRHNALYPEQSTELVATVEMDPNADEALFARCCAAVRHIGTNRNRGLGNVRLIYTAESATEQMIVLPPVPTEGERFEIRYSLALDAPVTLSGCAERLDEIPGRSVIGCLASQVDPASADFADLFLNGTVQWSALTPQICGVRSIPAPLSLVRLRNGSFVNRALAKKEELIGQKQKTVDGSYTALTQFGPRLARAESHSIYHHSHLSETLYTQEALDAGMIYAGTVTVPRRLAQHVLELLRVSRFSFGQSKTAQYGGCSLAAAPTIAPVSEELRSVPMGTPVWVLLDADMILPEGGICTADPADARRALSHLLGLEDRVPDGLQDYCQTRVISGYHAMWSMPKPQLPAFRGGSLFTFRAGTQSLPTAGRLGEYPQEGLGTFRVLTEAELQAYDGVKKGRIEHRTFADGTESKALEQAMAKGELERVFAEETSALYRERKVDRSIRKGTLGRVRQMVAEAKDIDDLYNRIDSIKVSDGNSDKPDPEQKKAKRLVQMVWNSTCGGHDSLLKLAGNSVGDIWKEPLLQMIHLLYYGKGGN